MTAARLRSDLTLTDQFCGAGGSSEGAKAAGVTVALALNHWKLAVETHNTNHPDALHDCSQLEGRVGDLHWATSLLSSNTPASIERADRDRRARAVPVAGLGLRVAHVPEIRALGEVAVGGADISQVDPRRYPRTDILLTSPECFPAGTLITASSGQVPIEEVVVGDRVLTHERRWRRVVRTQSRVADTIILRGQGLTPGIETTSNHKFWSRGLGGTGWRPASDMLGKHWSTPTTAEEIDGTDPPGGAFGDDLAIAWWLVGRWLGDGSLEIGKSRHGVVLTCGQHEAIELGGLLETTGASWGRRDLRTASSFICYDKKLHGWLRDNFGHGALNKGIRVGCSVTGSGRA
jgi:hypothetical protein